MLSNLSMTLGRPAMPYRLVLHGCCLPALAFALAFSATCANAGGKTLTLPDALALAMAQNPGLQVFDLRLEGLQGRRITADQNPALEAGLEVENFLGNDDLRGFDGAEYTLSLSSVLELGGQRQARVSLVDSRHERVEAERRADTLDVLGTVTQRFVATLALQEKLDLAAEAVVLAEATREIVGGRAERGAAPQAEVLRARAALGRTRIEQSRLQVQLQSRKIALASLWGNTSPDFETLEGDLFQAGSSDSFEALYQRVEDSPAIRIYASERRIREAEIRLARSQSEGDIRWQVGVRRFEDTDDMALAASFSVPLFSGRRNRGEIQTALAARDAVRFRQEDALLHLHARLFEAYHLRRQSIEVVARIRQQILPDLTEALRQTREAYENGRYGYIEWTAAQQELLSARQALVDAAATALLNQALIEQLTAQPLATVPGAPAR